MIVRDATDKRIKHASGPMGDRFDLPDLPIPEAVIVSASAQVVALVVALPLVVMAISGAAIRASWYAQMAVRSSGCERRTAARMRSP